MVEFDSIQAALNHKIDAESNLTVGDCLNVMNSSFLGRKITQLSFFIKGKGWIDDKKAQEKIKSLDSETKASIHNISAQIVNYLNDKNRLEKHLRNQDIFRTSQKKISRKEETKILKDLELLGGYHTDRTIQQLVREMKILADVSELRYEGL